MNNNSLFKKVLSFTLAAVAAAGSAIYPLNGFAVDGGVKFTVGTDIHIDNTKTELEVNYPENGLYFQASGSGNIYDQAASLTRDFLRKSAEEGADFVLLAGDLTRNGNEEQHRYTASLLSDFENETGVQVYVVPGNHDYFNSMPRDFKEYYADFGYNQALETDGATASYTADVGGEYRLIAVDSNNPGKDGDGFTDSLLGWIEEQAAKAGADGRQIIYMMHHPLLEHLYLGRILMKDFMLRDSKAVAEKFTQWGIRYVFTGHEHGNDTASYTGKNGAVVYDVLTTALSSYPLEYRYVTLSGDGADIKMRKIEKCNTRELVDGYTDEQKALLESDYEQFAYGLFRYSVEKKILRYVSPEFIKGKLKAEGGVPGFAVDSLFGAVTEALTMPLYNKTDEISIEKLAGSKGVKIPASDYGSLIELASAVVAAHYYGNENLASAENPECEILVKGLNTGLQYVLTKTGRAGLNALLNIIGTEIPTDELSPLFKAVSAGKEDSYKIAGQILYPLLDRFAVDSDLPDRDVFIPSQSQNAGQGISQSFFERIIIFFRRIIGAFSDIAVKLPI